MGRIEIREQRDLADERPKVVADALERLAGWREGMLSDHPTGTDPMTTVLDEGGPWHVRRQLPAYLKRLRETGRAEAAARLARRYADAAA